VTEREMTLSVNGERQYRHPNTGEMVPSVTNILGVMDKEALNNWAIDTTAQFAVDNLDVLNRLDRDSALSLLKGARWRSSKSAAEKGTDAHAILEDEGKGVSVLRTPLNGWVLDCWAGLNREFDIEVLEVEPTFWNGDVGYAGSADLVARVDGELAVVDYKTSQSGVYGETSLQLCAYAMAPTIIRPNGEEVDFQATYGEVQRTYAVWLRPDDDGKYVGPAGWSLLPMKYDQETWRAFQAAVILWQWKNVQSKGAVGKALNAKPLRRPKKRTAA
jgi:hypothetical protein